MLGLDLMAAHMIGDFILQTHQTATLKLQDGGVRLVHCVVYMIPVTLAASWHEHSMWGLALFVLANLLLHFIIDSRRWASERQWAFRPIMVDQTLHLVCLALTARLLTT